jgi:murein DD-endopeptidase MepM/ murein hydrolase activator NlpD
VRKTIALAWGCLLAAGWSSAFAAPASAMPVDLEIPVAPTPAKVDGALHLLYEVHVTNVSPRTLELTRIETMADAAPAPLADLTGAELGARMTLLGAADETANPALIPGGMRAVIFMDVALDAARKIPAGVRHRLTFSLKKPDGTAITRDVEGAAVAVRAASNQRLSPPLRGAGWVAADSMSGDAGGHRRTLMPVDGRLRAAQRFAIDWVRLGPSGRYFHDDATQNRNWYGFGAEVLAVADGRIAEVGDGIEENVAQSLPAAPVTLDNIAGNHVMLDLGHGRWALYAHLQRGSLRVKAGDKVRAGQVLALLGNTGNSDAPHLHFHLVDANSALGAEGLPYAFESFKVLGRVDAPEPVFDGSASWQPAAPAKPHPRRGELPSNYAVVEFP